MNDGTFCEFRMQGTPPSSHLVNPNHMQKYFLSPLGYPHLHKDGKNEK